MKHTKRRFVKTSLILSLLMLAALWMPSYASGTDDNSLTVKYVLEERAMPDVEFSLYRVATIDKEELTATAIPPYSDYHVLSSGGTWSSKAATLAGYVSRDGLPADVVKTTDANGLVRFDGLADGMYLIVGQSSRQGSYTYRPTPFLLFLPNTTDGLVWDSDIQADVKYTRRGGQTPEGPEEGETRDLRALKVWEDEGYEDQRPASITVDLLKDGEVFDSVELSAGNNWRYDWRGLAADASYEILEQQVPENYSVSVEEGGITFIITNTVSEETEIIDGDTPLIDRPDLPGGESGSDSGLTDLPDGDVPLTDLPKLPQTGQLWWPVPILTVAGIAMLLAGVIVRRRSA